MNGRRAMAARASYWRMRGLMSPARSALVALAAVAGTAGAVALLGGCGDDSKAVVDRDATLRLRVDEFRITPENVRTRAGRVHLVVRNTGRLTHNVAVETFSDSPETDRRSSSAARRPPTPARRCPSPAGSR